jgi:hypothetical protein
MVAPLGRDVIALLAPRGAAIGPEPHGGAVETLGVDATPKWAAART